jgi:uncharacterized protein YcgI (DUF1989 family)
MAADEPAVPPPDAAARRAVPAVTVYRVDMLPAYDAEFYERARLNLTKIDEVIVPPRDGRAFRVPAGHFFRIVSIEGPQVGDLNLWNASDLGERFFSGKTRQMHATHVGVGDRLWSTLPAMRPMATITHDTLHWYGYDDDGGGIHDVIGTRCDPYTYDMLLGVEYDHFCHSNLTRALAAATGLTLEKAEPHVHDVMNVFMCTGFTRDTHQYFKKASPVRPGDFIELFAEIDLLGALSACPAGDCGASLPPGEASCHPLLVEVFRPGEGAIDGWQSPGRSGYGGRHGAS